MQVPRLTISGRAPLPTLPYQKIKNAILGTEYELSVFFAPPKLAQKLNKTYRNKTYTPNTLSFSLSKKSGEIIICRSAARKEYKKFGCSYHDYLGLLFIHSALHLKGYAHSGTMEALETRYFKKYFNAT